MIQRPDTNPLVARILLWTLVSGLATSCSGLKPPAYDYGDIELLVHGRVLVTTPNERTRADFRWALGDDFDELELSGLWGLGRTRLVRTNGTLTVIRANGQELSGDELMAELQPDLHAFATSTSWRSWLLIDPTEKSEVGESIYDTEGRLIGFVWDGYEAKGTYQPFDQTTKIAKSLNISGPLLNVRVVIDRWSVNP